MKPSIISTILGATALAIPGVTGSALPIDAVKRYEQSGPCYELHGEPHCIVAKPGQHGNLEQRLPKHPYYAACPSGPDGVLHCIRPSLTTPGNSGRSLNKRVAVADELPDPVIDAVEVAGRNDGVPDLKAGQAIKPKPPTTASKRGGHESFEARK
ncbi:MAG: hypothetical protein Q9211_005040, partial [Gyalolechia sp. 1 TL-2023]